MFRSAPFYIENIIYIFIKTRNLNEEVNRTEPSPSVSIPWFNYKFMITFVIWTYSKEVLKIFLIPSLVFVLFISFERGATALSITTYSIMTLSIMTFTIMTLSITTFGIMTLSITTFSIMSLTITIKIPKLSIMALNAVMLRAYAECRGALNEL